MVRPTLLTALAVDTWQDYYPHRLLRAFVVWLGSWRRVIYFGALALVMVLSPATYDRTNRSMIARQIYVTTWQILPWFTLLSSMISLVMIRVVVVNAVSYGLAAFALEMVVRILVLEFIPLVAALFVTMRAALAARPAVLGIYIPRDLGGLGGLTTERIRDELVPRVIAYAFSVLTMIVVSGIVALILSYIGVYGFSRFGLPQFARTVGQVFDFYVTVGFALKVFFFSLAVAVIPIAASLDRRDEGPGEASGLQPGTVRMFMALFFIEGLSLVLKYV